MFKKSLVGGVVEWVQAQSFFFSLQTPTYDISLGKHNLVIHIFSMEFNNLLCLRTNKHNFVRF